MSFVTITLYVSSQQVFIVVCIYFVDSVQKLLDTHSYVYGSLVSYLRCAFGCRYSQIIPPPPFFLHTEIKFIYRQTFGKYRAYQHNLQPYDEVAHRSKVQSVANVLKKFVTIISVLTLI